MQVVEAVRPLLTRRDYQISDGRIFGKDERFEDGAFRVGSTGEPVNGRALARGRAQDGNLK